MKIGVYGGTFNPIHLGHLNILDEFAERLHLDEVWLIPTGTPPHKESPHLASSEHRLAMCELAVKDCHAKVVVSRMETDRAGKSYTSDTLRELHETHPHDELCFLMGEDMFLTLHNWVRPQVICDCATLCAAPRSEDGLARLTEQKARLEELFSARCVINPIPYLSVSSTEIRERITKGESLSNLVPESVERYIYEHGLYQSGGESA